MKKEIWLIPLALLVGISLVATGCPALPEEAVTPPDDESLTGTPQIGDKVKSGSVQATVLRVEETHSISGSDITVESEEGFILIPVIVALENLGETSVELTLAPGSTTLHVEQQQRPLERVGVVFNGSYYFVYGSSGQMNREPVDESWKLTGDFTEDVWLITLKANAHTELILVYSVPVGSSGFELALPGFAPISLRT